MLRLRVFVTHLLQRIRLEPTSLPHPAPSYLSSNKFSHLVVTVFWLVGTNSKLFCLNLTGLCVGPQSWRGPCGWWSPRGFFIWAGCIHLSVIDGLSSDLVYYQSPRGFFIRAGCIHLSLGNRNPSFYLHAICSCTSLLTSTVRSAVLLGTQAGHLGELDMFG